MAALIDGAFAEVLEAHRDVCNQRVAEAIRAVPDFDVDRWRADLLGVVAPIVDEVDQAGHGFTALVAMTLFDVTVDLHRQGRCTDVIRQGWTALLPALAEPLAFDPPGVVARLTNALSNMEATPGGRPGEWIDRLDRVIAAGAPIDEVWRAGQVAAWRCGAAGYRPGALAVASTLSPAVLRAALGATPTDLPRLLADPWFDPSADPGSASVGTTDTSAVPASVRVGGFRGFGGPFVAPPVLSVEDDIVVADDGAERWFVLADAFGTALVRAGPRPGTAMATAPGTGTAAASGPAGLGPPPAALAGMAEITSWVARPGALVATSALSHVVTFVRTGP